MAIDLARGIGAADRAMRAGRRGVRAGLQRRRVPAHRQPGGDRRLRRPRPRAAPAARAVRAARSASSTRGCPTEAIRREGAEPAALDELLRASRVVFVLAAATSDNEGFLGERELRLIPPGGVLALMSRAGVVDFDALVRVVAEGRLRAAVDVFPEEPLAADHPIRALDGVLLSPHRAGGMPEAFLGIGRLAVGDLELVLRGLPPVALPPGGAGDGRADALAARRALLTPLTDPARARALHGRMRLHDHAASGNCYKVRLLLAPARASRASASRSTSSPATR